MKKLNVSNRINFVLKIDVRYELIFTNGRWKYLLIKFYLLPFIRLDVWNYLPSKQNADSSKSNYCTCPFD